MQRELEVLFKMQGNSFTDYGTVNLGIEIYHKNIRGHCNLEIPLDEYNEAISKGMLGRLVDQYFISMLKEVEQKQYEQIEELQEELSKVNGDVKNLENQMNMSNISMTMMLMELESKIPIVEENQETGENPVEEIEEKSNASNKCGGNGKRKWKQYW